jgi:DTW domain-containing protein YfiP
MTIPDTSLATPARAICGRCRRPQAACICGCIRAVPTAVEVLILQHPLEVSNAKGSARLLHLCLPNSRIEMGETFAPDDLQAMLSGPRRSVLLYPDTVEGESLGIAPPPSFDAAWAAAPQQLRLVVLDGTWRKSRKMLYLNPLLQTLPRLPLRDMPPSHYSIRKAHLPDQLSTLEATSHALAQLEGDAQKLVSLMLAFDRFVAQQRAYVP